MAPRQPKNLPPILDPGADDLAGLQPIFGRRIVLEQVQPPPMPRHPIACGELPIDRLLFPILMRGAFHAI